MSSSGRLEKDSFVYRDGVPKKARPASFFYALDQRPILEKKGLSLGHIGRVLGQAWGTVAPDYKAELEERAGEDKRRYDAEMNFAAQSASHLDSPLSWLHPSIGPRTNEGDGIWSVDAADDARLDLLPRRRDNPDPGCFFPKPSAFFTVGLPSCTVKSGDKCYYEVTILATSENSQFGWARRGFEVGSENGCGDDAYSYACDGHRRKKWHQATARDWNPDASWKVGDVIGCMLDLDSREICFSVNGAYDEPAFRDISVGSAYFPALTMGTGMVAINVGARAFKHRPDGYRAVDPPPLLPDSMLGCLSDCFPTLNGPTPAPKPLTGAAALLETLDKFKAKNGGVDDPYYAAMRSALEELEIEEREEGS